MPLNLRQKQTECIIRMLNLNQPVNTIEEFYKILILDQPSSDILCPLFQDNDLDKHGITLQLVIDKLKEPIHDVTAVYFIRPTPDNIQRIILDASKPFYGVFHLNFSSWVPTKLLEDLAFGLKPLRSGVSHDIVSGLSSSFHVDHVPGLIEGEGFSRVSKVHDQYLDFVTLEDNLFSLAYRDCYLELNDPSNGDKKIEIIGKIVDGLFCVLVTLGVVPVIKCPRGGAAEMVAAGLEQKIKYHLSKKDNLFREVGNFAASFKRPVLCLFDRDFDLAVGVQHDFRYRPLVHELLGLRLNKTSVQQGEKGKTKTFQLDGRDPFWKCNGRLEFSKLGPELKKQYRQYSNAISDVHGITGKTQKRNEVEIDGTELTGMSGIVVDSLPELANLKQVLEKHGDIATLLTSLLMKRSIDLYSGKEKEMMNSGSIGLTDLKSVLSKKGNQTDKLRFAIMYLISVENIPQCDIEMVESTLTGAGVDTTAFQYVKMNKSENVKSASVSSGHKLALARTVEEMMKRGHDPERDTDMLFDPRASKPGSGSYYKVPFKEAIVFMIGGGNHAEYESLQELAASQQPTKHIIYGATEILTGSEFVEQLALLGKKMGLGGSNAPAPH